MNWDAPTAAWWLEEVEQDPAYGSDVASLFADLVPPEQEGWCLDLGCGQGRLLTPKVIGVDRSLDLLAAARTRGAVAAADIRTLPFESATFQGVYLVLVLEHLVDIGPVFTEAARVVADDGWMVLVVNHPFFTSPESGPVIDSDDGEVLWRWGRYLEPGSTVEPVGGVEVVFHHRPFSELLTGAAAAGWDLERVIERALGPGGDPILAVQTQVPRLLGARWRRRRARSGLED